MDLTTSNQTIYHPIREFLQVQKNWTFITYTHLSGKSSVLECTFANCKYVLPVHREEQSQFGVSLGSASSTIAADLQRALAHKLTAANNAPTGHALKNGGAHRTGAQQPAQHSHGGFDSRRHSHSRTHSVEELQRLGLGGFALAGRDLCSRGSGGSGGSAGGAASGGGCGSGGSSIGGGYGCCCRSLDRDSVKISLENTNTCTDSLVTAIDDEAFLLGDFLPHDNDASFCGGGGGSALNSRCGGGGGHLAGGCSCSGACGGGGVGCGVGASCGSGGKVHFGGGGGDDLSLYGTPKEELGPIAPMGNHNGPSSGGGGVGSNGYGGGRGSLGGSGANVSTSMGAGGNAGGPAGGAAGESGKQSFIKNQLQALFQPTDNKLAMKLFGSKKALMKERIRQKETGHWVIHPCSSFR